MNISQNSIIFRNIDTIFIKKQVSKDEHFEKHFSPYYKNQKIQYKSYFGLIELFSPKKYL